MNVNGSVIESPANFRSLIEILSVPVALVAMETAVKNARDLTLQIANANINTEKPAT